MKKVLWLIAALIIGVTGVDARVLRGTAPGSSFNGSKLQTNPNFLQFAGGFPLLNTMRASQTWAFTNNAPAPVTPDILDADNYLKSNSGNAAGGVYTRFFWPTQAQKPGAYIYKWDGDGQVGSAFTNATAVFYTISGITQSGGIQTVTLSSLPKEMRAGQPISITNVTDTGGGTWGGGSGFSQVWRVLDVNTGTSSFRVNTGVTYTGTVSLSGSSRATFTKSTTVQNPTANTLNGSGRYAVQPSTAQGPNLNQFDAFVGIESIASTSNYPHNMAVVHVDDEAALDSGEYFTTKWKQTIAKFGVVRFLNWQPGNNSNVTTWNTRKSLTSYSWDSFDLRSDFYAGATTSLTGRTYAASAPAINSATGAAWGGLTHGSTIHTLIAQGVASYTATFTSGAVNISIPGHTYSVGDFVALTTSSGATIGGGFSYGYYYCAVAVAANTVQLASDCGSSAITPSSSSSGTITSVLGWRTYVPAFTNGNANISIPGHNYVVGDQIVFQTFDGNAVKPSNVNYNQPYFVKTASAGVVTISATSGGATITPNATSSGSILSSVVLFINFGSTGAKPILNVYSKAMTNNQWPEAFDRNSLATFVYDSTLDAYTMFGGNSDQGSVGLINGMPYEAMMALCVSTGSHPYWVTPPLTTVPTTDFMPSLMLYAKNNSPSWMIPRFEGPNELWNGVFTQTNRASAIAAKLGWAYDFQDFYGASLSTLGQTAAYIYGIGNLGTKYHLYGGVQTAGDLNASLPRFMANSYVASASPQSPLSGPWGTITFTAVPPAINGTTGGSVTYVSHLVNAQYYQSNAYALGSGSGTQNMTSLAAAWSGTKFTGTITAGALAVSSVDMGDPLAIGKTIFGYGVPAGVTITGGSAPNWTLSNSSFSLPSSGFTAGADLTAPTKLANSVVDTVVNATITGSNFVVNSITSGLDVGVGYRIYGGTVAVSSFVFINGGTYPNYTLSSAPGNQTASFNIGADQSLTRVALTYGNWASWVKNNFNITRMAGYEGGYSDDYRNIQTWDLLSYASKQEFVLQGYAKTNFDNFRGVGTTVYPGGFTAEFPSVFNTTGSYPIGDAWSALDDIYQTPPSPQWNAISAY